MDWHHARTLKDRLAWALDRKQGATQADLARACATRPPSVSDWFSGKTKSLKSKSARSAANFLNVDQVWLETGFGSPFGIVTTSAEKPPADYAASPSIVDVVSNLGKIISQADPISRAALPGLLSMLVEHPEKSFEIGKKIESVLNIK